MATIEERAHKEYPENHPCDYECRESFRKACEEYESLPKIRVWVAINLGGVPQFFLRKPYRNRKFGMWENMGEEISLPYNSFPEITWESEPIEVELLIRKV